MALAAPTTFFVSPDTHFTKCGGAPSTLENLHGVADMNALPGTVYPTASKWKGSVASAISGVVIPGDLVDDGCSMTPSATDPGCAAQWANYTTVFKVAPALEQSSSPSLETSRPETGTTCAYPALEGVGNHDGGNSSDPTHGLVRRGVIARNEQRAQAPGFAGAANYRMSPNHLHYSWDWEGVHFVMLGVYPGAAGDCAGGTGVPGTGCASASPPWGWHSPEHSLDFLVDGEWRRSGGQ
jgi:hypothetical protein